MDNDHYTGAGWTGDESWGPMRPLRRHEWQQEDHNRQAELLGWQPNPDAILRGHTAELLANIDTYNRIIIRSWDLAGAATQTGTIIRFENTRQHQRSEDYRVALRQGGYDRLNPNTDRLREEMDMTAIMGQAQQWRRWAGANTEHDAQLLVMTQHHQVRVCWLCLADQIFIPIMNQARESDRGQPRVDFEQANDKKNRLVIKEALAFQRMWENTLLGKDTQ